MNKLNDYHINIAILGIGNIGARHLESIIKSELKINIFVFDICEKRSKEVKNIYKHVKDNITIKAIKNIKELQQH